MANGILFYSNFPVITPLLTVALHSLRKNYDGNIHVCLGDETPAFYQDAIAANRDVTHEVIPERYLGEPNLRKRQQKGWYEKPFVLRHHNPFDKVVFYDCDHVFYKKFDLSIFDSIDEYDLTTSVASGLPGRHGKIRQQMNAATGYQFSKVPKMSAGCIGYKRSSGLAEEWVKYFRICRGAGGLMSKLADEFGLSILFCLGHGKYLSNKWSWVHPKGRVFSCCPDKADAIHFAAGRYNQGNLFADALTECVRDNYMGIKDDIDQHLRHNPVTNRFLANAEFRHECGI